MINLPHQKPVRFVNNIIDVEDDIALISCSFPTIPTLAMISEAAAQSSIAFSKDKEEKIGFLFKKNDIVRKLNYNNKVIELNTKDYFSFNIDTIWSNLFWPYRTLVGNPNNFDDEIFNFIKEIFLIHFIQFIVIFTK